eukprot:gene4385-14512_t
MKSAMATNLLPRAMQSSPADMAEFAAMLLPMRARDPCLWSALKLALLSSASDMVEFAAMLSSMRVRDSRLWSALELALLSTAADMVEFLEMLSSRRVRKPRLLSALELARLSSAADMVEFAAMLSSMRVRDSRLWSALELALLAAAESKSLEATSICRLMHFLSIRSSSVLLGAQQDSHSKLVTAGCRAASSQLDMFSSLEVGQLTSALGKLKPAGAQQFLSRLMLAGLRSLPDLDGYQPAAFAWGSVQLGTKNPKIAQALLIDSGYQLAAFAWGSAQLGIKNPKLAQALLDELTTRLNSGNKPIASLVLGGAQSNPSSSTGYDYVPGQELLMDGGGKKYGSQSIKEKYEHMLPMQQNLVALVKSAVEVGPPSKTAVLNKLLSTWDKSPGRPIPLARFCDSVKLKLVLEWLASVGTARKAIAVLKPRKDLQRPHLVASK